MEGLPAVIPAGLHNAGGIEATRVRADTENKHSECNWPWGGRADLYLGGLTFRLRPDLAFAISREPTGNGH
jgi:hypothetical protein